MERVSKDAKRCAEGCVPLLPLTHPPPRSSITVASSPGQTLFVDFRETRVLKILHLIILRPTWGNESGQPPAACQVPTDGRYRRLGSQVLQNAKRVSRFMQRPNRSRLRKPAVYVERRYFYWLVCTRNPSRQKFIRRKGGCACPKKLFCPFLFLFFSARPGSS